MKTFQSLFPPLSPGTISLSSARRIVLISYNAEKGTIDFRHYLISVKPYGVSKRVQKVLQGATSSSRKLSSSGLLDLGNERDVADFLLRKRGENDPGGGYESAVSDASSVAGDEGEAVSLAGDYVGRNNKKGQKKAIKLEEIGPRMELRLIKITEGLPGKEGGVIYHDIGLYQRLSRVAHMLTPTQLSVKKTKKQINGLKAAAVERERLKKQRREEQEQNVEKKKALAAQKKGKGKGTQLDEGEKDEGVASSDDIVDEREAEDDDDWDDEEEISEGEEEEEVPSGSEAESEPEPPRPTKKAKVRVHR
jgi:ribosome biogenesis protein SSF1/2